MAPARAAALLAVAATAVVTSGAGARPAQLHLVRVLSGLAHPVHVAAPSSEPNRLYVVEKAGRIMVAIDGTLRATPFLNITSRVSSTGERGLLSVAFHPDYALNRRLYVYFTDLNGDIRVLEYRSDPLGQRVLPKTARLLLYQDHPASNHNGGQLAFGPDGLLYIGLGDGGTGARDNGQNLKTKLGKIWKLNVDVSDAKPKMVAYGLRNPWRYAFDRENGDLYVADVGQRLWEEVDYVAASDHALKNFEWPVYEGNVRYTDGQLAGPGEPTGPIHVYSHDDGCSITGGFVYRGPSAPAAVGRYFYGDYCSGAVWSLRVVDGRATDVTLEPFTVAGLSSFGEDARGEVYLVSLRGSVYRLTE